MARFVVGLISDLPAQQVWDRVLDLDAHTQVIPLTTVTGPDGGPPPGELAVGTGFTAWTGVGRVLGRFGFADPMVVQECDPPHLMWIVKTGRVIRGEILLRIRPEAAGSRLEWNQQIRVRGLPGALDPVVAGVGRAAYGHVIRRLLRTAPGSR